MLIYIFVFLIVIGFLIFRPFKINQSGKRNYKLLWMFLYFVILVVLPILYCVLNGVNTFFEPANKLHQNSIILDPNDKRVYKIKINGMSEYDGKTKNEIYALRKRLVMENSQFVNSNYEPNENVLNIDDNALWWGTKGMICKGPGRYANVGLSKESNYANNPLILMNLDMRGAVTELADGSSECADELPWPTSLEVKPSENTITVRYNLSNFIKKREGSHFQHVIDNYHVSLFMFGNINAQDFGYTFAYPDKIQNIEFFPTDNSYRYRRHHRYRRHRNQKEIIPLNSYWCVGDSCIMPEGCNNICNPPRAFAIKNYPVYVKFKLFKKYPFSPENEPDLWFEIFLD